MTSTVRTSVEDGIGLVVLDRPESANALSAPMVLELIDAVERLSADLSVSALVLTGAGSAFCAGADLSDSLFDPSREQEAMAVLERGYRLAHVLHTCRVPTVAAVNGPAIGAGLSLSALCDRRWAAAGASFLLGYSSFGLVPDLGASRMLPYLLGGARALDLALADRPIDARRALEIGLLHGVVDGDVNGDVNGDVVAAATTDARRLAALPAGVVAHTRQALLELSALPFASAMDREREHLAHSMAQEGSRAAVRAFAERQARRTSDDPRERP